MTKYICKSCGGEMNVWRISEPEKIELTPKEPFIVHAAQGVNKAWIEYFSKVAERLGVGNRDPMKAMG